MSINKELKKLNIKLPKIIGRPYYISKLPTKKDYQKLILYRVVFFIFFCLALYMMNDYMQEYFHLPHYKQMNDGRLVDIEANIFIIYVIVVIYTFVKLFIYSFKLYVVGDKGCIVYNFKSSKHYSVKTRLFSDTDFSLYSCMKEYKDIEYKNAVTKMYNYFTLRRER